MDKVNVLQFKNGKVALATGGLSISVNNQEPIVVKEIEVDNLAEALANPDDHKNA